MTLHRQKREAVGRTAITGATGFVGRHLVAHLIAQRRDLTLLVQNPERCPRAWHDNAMVRIVRTGPLEKAVNLDEALQGVTTLMHLGGLAHVKSAGPEQFMAANAEASRLLAGAATRAGVAAFLHLSSIAAVTRNAASGRISDTTPADPDLPYGQSKLLAETHVAALARKGIFAISLRPPLVVGADAPGNWRNLQRLALMSLPLPFGAVNNRRSYIGVGTLVEMLDHLAIYNWQPEDSGDYCIANAETLSLAQVLSLLRQAMGKRPALLPVPTLLLKGPLVVLGRERIAQSLFGDLDIDSRKFHETFRFTETSDIREEIRRSGSEFALNLSN